MRREERRGDIENIITIHTSQHRAVERKYEVDDIEGEKMANNNNNNNTASVTGLALDMFFAEWDEWENVLDEEVTQDFECAVEEVCWHNYIIIFEGSYK